MSDRAIANLLGQVTAEAAAAMLHKRGVGLLSIKTDTGLVEVLNDVLREHQIRLARAPTDFDAVRAELARLIDRAIADPFHPPHLDCVSAQSRALGERLARNRLKAAE
ncbi:hypothetical protein [Methylobacterium brachythecii]|uniref:Putative coiled-coil protein SlyX n=1 Tax=Methylobacterium brachythecii TaxID=1176177 RepID=A0A7W6F915_9HYPH|nr:hypothetical protein [Methylobacterium brachythecii]MBB3905077.1 putative coiled-coil protein SlyX [Methylobacterium brachythecii]GLS44415.1 hypothetical protein GCM10007884_24030 [Methylobacterium brachythecii]